jgi:uncharacterized protein YqhQ
MSTLLVQAGSALIRQPTFLYKQAEAMKQERIAVGGQAVIEGVMMRAPTSYAVAVRRADGQIVTRGERLVNPTEKHPVLKLPVLRGVVVLMHSMLLGIKALNFSISVASGQVQPKTELIEPDPVLVGPAKAVAASAIAFATVFILLPLLLTNMLFVGFSSESIWAWLGASLKPARPSVAFNLVDGLIRIILFLAMIWGLSWLGDTRRLFEYHGAEHKVVYAWEAGEALTVENARSKRREHPRCGTSFLMVVMLVAIIAFSVVVSGSLLVNFATRVVLLPAIAGLSYEVIRASAHSRSQWLLSVITRPGLWLQKLTTKEPDESQLEVAIRALEEAIKLELSESDSLAQL